MLVPAPFSCLSPPSSASTALLRYREDEFVLFRLRLRRALSNSGAPSGPEPLRFGTRTIGLVIGCRDVPVHDSVETIQQRSNSLVPYELLEIVQAKAEVVEDFAKFDILLKLKRGTKEEKMKAEVHKNLEGVFVLN